MAERFSIAIPIEAIVNSEGSVDVVYYTISSDEEMSRIIKREMDNRLGVESQQMSMDDYQRKSFFGFSASDWKMCNWEPQGPRKNWLIPPENPTLN